MTSVRGRVEGEFRKQKMVDGAAVCRVGEIENGKGRCVRFGDKLVAVFHVDGHYFAIDDVCPHMGASLSDGEVGDGIVTCPWHGWRFRVADGVWADNPRIKIDSYIVETIDGEVRLRKPNTAGGQS